MDIEKIKQEVIKRFDKQFELYSQFALRECLAEFIEKEIEEAYEAGKKEVEITNVVGTTDYKEHSDIITNNLIAKGEGKKQAIEIDKVIIN